MGIFDFNRKEEKILDLSDKYPKEKMQPVSVSKDEIMGNLSMEEKKRKLAKRISDMDDKIEDLSTQIYHLQQRIEVLERKTQVGRLE